MAIEVQVDRDLSVGATEPATFVLLANTDSDTLDSAGVIAQNSHIVVSSVSVQDSAYYYRNGSHQIAADKAVAATIVGVSAGIGKLRVTGTCASGRVIVVDFNIEVK